MDLPKPIPSYFAKELVGIGIDQLRDRCEELFKVIMEITYPQSKAIEELTRSQSKSAIWMQQRAGRITASVIGYIFRTSIDDPAIWLLNMVCYPAEKSFKGNDATR